MKVRDVMSRPVITEDEDVSVTRVSEDMELSGIGSVVITRSNKPIGIITDRDIALKIYGMKREAHDVKAKEIMSSPLVTIEPEASLEKACVLLTEKEIRRLPVIEDGKLKGMVSVRNVLTRAPECVHKFYPAEEDTVAEGLEVGDIMTVNVITEDGETPVNTIAEEMEKFGIRSVVITEKNKPVGIITDRDIASKVIIGGRKASDIKARDIMSSPLISIEPDVSLGKACAVLAAEGIGRLPVIDDDKFVGIISVRNILTRAPRCVHRIYPAE